MPLPQLLCTAFLILLATSVLAAISLCYALSAGLDGLVSGAGFAIGAVVTAFFLGTAKRVPMFVPRASLTGTAVTIVCGLFLVQLMRWTVWIEGDSARINNAANLGDLPLHLTYAQFIAKGALWWPDNPILSGAKTHYPLGMDALSAMLVTIGLSPESGMNLVGVLCAIVAVTMLFFWGGAFSVAALVLNGGLFGLEALGVSLHRAPGAEIFWKSIPLALFNPQRGFQFALPAVLLLLTSWRARFIEREGDSSKLSPPWWEVLCYSALPLFHMHSFIFLSFLLAIWFVILPTARKAVFRLVAFSVVPATAIVFEMTDGFSGLSIVHIHPIWKGYDFVSFWVWNFGALVTIVPLSAVLAFSPWSQIADRALVVPALVLILFFSVVAMQPFYWENMKFFMWCYVLLLPAIHSTLVRHLSPVTRTALVVALCAPGAIDLWKVLRPDNEGLVVYNIAEVNDIDHHLRHIPVEERIAIYPTYNHPVALSGHAVALGYQGHIWVHGFDYRVVDQKVNRLMRGDPDWRSLAKDLEVRYLFWGEREDAHYRDSLKPWESRLPIIESAWGKLYVIDW